MSKINLYDGSLTVNYEMTDEKKDKIVEEILKFVKKNNCIDGEHLFQDDECYIDSPELVSNLLDIFEFETECDD